MSACKEFFGLKEGQTALDFAKEVRTLSPADREELKPGLESAMGVTIQDPQ